MKLHNNGNVFELQVQFAPKSQRRNGSAMDNRWSWWVGFQGVEEEGVSKEARARAERLSLFVRSSLSSSVSASAFVSASVSASASVCCLLCVWKGLC